MAKTNKDSKPSGKSILTTTHCLHRYSVLDKETGTLRSVECNRDATVGFLCNGHDRLVLAKKPTTEHPYVGDPYNEVVESIIQTERKALDGVAREVVGLVSKIQFIFGVRMHTDPKKVFIPEPVPEMV